MKIRQAETELFHMQVGRQADRHGQWCTEGGVWGVQNPSKFRRFDKAKPNSLFRGKYIRINLIRIRVSLICKLSGTLD
jgi:hypothetical protein